jgi:hypothetical protein
MFDKSNSFLNVLKVPVHSYDDPSFVDWSQTYKIPKVIEKSICPACIATDEFCGNRSI